MHYWLSRAILHHYHTLQISHSAMSLSDYFQGYVETRDTRHLYRVYCLEDIVYTINEERDLTPPDYESVVTADLEDLPNYDQAVQHSCHS